MESPLDKITKGVSLRLAEGGSRRSFLGWLTRWSVMLAAPAALVVTEAKAVPVDRSCQAADPCKEDKNKGLSGKPCTCCGNNGSDTRCPDGCENGNKGWKFKHKGIEYVYFDCCCPEGVSKCAAGCATCGNGGTAWCPDGKVYRCTQSRQIA